MIGTKRYAFETASYFLMDLIKRSIWLINSLICRTELILIDKARMQNYQGLKTLSTPLF